MPRHTTKVPHIQNTWDNQIHQTRTGYVCPSDATSKTQTPCSELSNSQDDHQQSIRQMHLYHQDSLIKYKICQDLSLTRSQHRISRERISIVHYRVFIGPLSSILFLRQSVMHQTSSFKICSLHRQEVFSSVNSICSMCNSTRNANGF